MIEAAFWGLVAASSLVLGAGLGFVFDMPRRLRGLILAFGAGALFGAVAYELVADAIELSASGLEVGLGFGLGAVAFYAGSVAIDRVAAGTGRGSGPATGRMRARREGLAILFGATLDAIPESVVLGLTLIGGAGVGVPVLVAIFIANIPEALSASEDLVESGLRRRTIVATWVAVAIASSIAAGLGFLVLEGASPGLIAGIQAFAAGAILAMLAESAVPEANELGGRPVSLATCLGFAVSSWLSLGLM